MKDAVGTRVPTGPAAEAIRTAFLALYGTSGAVRVNRAPVTTLSRDPLFESGLPRSPVQHLPGRLRVQGWPCKPQSRGLLRRPSLRGASSHRSRSSHQSPGSETVVDGLTKVKMIAPSFVDVALSSQPNAVIALTSALMILCSNL